MLIKLNYRSRNILFSESGPFVSEEVESEGLANRIAGNGIKNTADILFSDPWIVRDRPVQVTAEQPRFSRTAERVVKQILLGTDIRLQVPLPSEIPLDLPTETNRRTIDDHLQIRRYSTGKLWKFFVYHSIDNLWYNCCQINLNIVKRYLISFVSFLFCNIYTE